MTTDGVTSHELLRQALEKQDGEGQVTKPEDGEDSNPADGGKPNSERDISPNPLEGVNLENLTVEHLLGHETVGPLLKSHIDTDFAAQMEGKTDALREEVRAEEAPKIEEEVTQRLAPQVLGQLFGQFEQTEQVQELLEGNAEFKTLWDKAKANGIPTSDLASEEGRIARRATVHAYAFNLKTLQAVIERSDLSAEVKEEIQPEKFADKYPTDGDKAMLEWSSAVHEALIRHGATKLMNEEWEAFKEEQLAELEKELPKGSVPARGSAAEPRGDIMEGSSRDHLSRALAQ